MKKLLLLLALTPTLIIGQTQIGTDLVGDAPLDVFGKSVSMSADGSIVAIGGDLNDAGGNDAGHVRVFENVNGTWTQLGADILGEASGDRSGISVSLSSDGSILAVGAWLNDANGSSSRHARVFEFTGGSWTQLGPDIDGLEAGAQFGIAVSLSGDGDILAVGANLNDANGTNSGEVRVFTYDGSSWTQLGSPINGEVANDGLGATLSLSRDGTTLAVGGPNSGQATNGAGLARVYRNQNGNWVQLGTDFLGVGMFDGLGQGLSLSANGNVLALSALGAGTNDVGIVQVFAFQNDQFNQIGADIIGDAFLDGLGYSLSLSDNGSVLAIGARGGFNQVNSTGYARIYQRINGDWTQVGAQIQGDNNGDEFGTTIKVSSDGASVIVGAPQPINTANLPGVAKVFDVSQILSVDSQQIGLEVVLSPNPATAVATISLQDGVILQKIRLYAVTGKLLRTYEELRVNVSDLAAGIYLVEILTDVGGTTRKLIIE